MDFNELCDKIMDDTDGAFIIAKDGDQLRIRCNMEPDYLLPAVEEAIVRVLSNLAGLEEG